MARPTGDPSFVSCFKPAGPASRKQLQRKQQSVDDAENETHFNDGEYGNDIVYETFDMVYMFS